MKGNILHLTFIPQDGSFSFVLIKIGIIFSVMGGSKITKFLDWLTDNLELGKAIGLFALGLLPLVIGTSFFNFFKGVFFYIFGGYIALFLGCVAFLKVWKDRRDKKKAKEKEEKEKQESKQLHTELKNTIQETGSETTNIIAEVFKTEIAQLKQENINKLVVSNAVKDSLNIANDLLAQGKSTEARTTLLNDRKKIENELNELSIAGAYHEFLIGSSFLDENDYENALVAFQRTVTYQPTFAEAWSNYGVTLWYLERYEDALKSYDKAIEYKPAYAKAWYNRGLGLERLGRYEEAVQSLDEAVKHEPNHASAWYSRGTILGKNLLLYEEAVQNFDEAIKYQPNHAKAWYNRGIALGELRQYEDEINSYDKAIEYKPDYSSAWYNRGIALGNLDRYEEAIENFNQALKVAPIDWPFRESAEKSIAATKKKLAENAQWSCHTHNFRSNVL